jgi:hypothetical protein
VSTFGRNHCPVCAGICIICNLSTFGSVDNNEINQKLTAKDKLRIEDFIIGGIYINQPIEEVIEILGKPIKIQVIPDGFKGSDEIIHYFPDITIITSERRKRVFQIKIDNKGIRTFRGIAVGDHERKRQITPTLPNRWGFIFFNF